MKFSEARLEEIFTSIKRTKVAVVGDLMLDRYVWGVVDRISPEAPVPVVNQTGESSNLGGAANVAANVSSLGATASLIGMVGDDPEGEKLRSIIRSSGFSDAGIVVDNSRPTSVKTRVIAQNQHVVRIDRETNAHPPTDVEDELLARFFADLGATAAVILEDYNKGVLSTRVIEQVIAGCRKRGVFVGVDPKKENFWAYKGATLFKPNVKELETALGRKLKDDGDLKAAGIEVQERLDVRHLLITRGEKGMALFEKGVAEFIPTRAHQVQDVSGAGDTVIATIVTALAGGADIHEATGLANLAASIVIAEIGAVPIDATELRRAALGR